MKSLICLPHVHAKTGSKPVHVFGFGREVEEKRGERERDGKVSKCVKHLPKNALYIFPENMLKTFTKSFIKYNKMVKVISLSLFHQHPSLFTCHSSQIHFMSCVKSFYQSINQVNQSINHSQWLLIWRLMWRLIWRLMWLASPHLNSKYECARNHTQARVR